MKFLLGLAAICGSSTSVAAAPPEEARLLAVHESRRRVSRRRGTVRGGRKSCEWRPSLSVISEDNMLVAERKNNSTNERPLAAAAAGWRMNLKRKVSSVSQTQEDGPRSSKLERDNARRVPLSSISFSPTPFMF